MKSESESETNLLFDATQMIALSKELTLRILLETLHTTHVLGAYCFGVDLARHQSGSEFLVNSLTFAFTGFKPNLEFLETSAKLLHLLLGLRGALGFLFEL